MLKPVELLELNNIWFSSECGWSVLSPSDVPWILIIHISKDLLEGKKQFYFSAKRAIFKNSAFVDGVMFLYLVAKPYKAVDPRQK